MNDKESKLECAKIAAQVAGSLGPEAVLLLARQLYDWVTSTCEPKAP